MDNTVENTTIESATVVQPRAAGFWRRLGAFFIDGLLLGLVGALAGWLAFDALAQFGGYARIIGFLVALAYFGVMNSALCGGRTIGKRLLGLRVAGQDGAALSVPRSLLRYSVLGIPFFLNQAPFSEEVLFSPWGYVLSLVIFGGILSIAYLFLFNRRGRRSLHDLLVGSTVVRDAAGTGAAMGLAPWRGHLVVVAVLMAAAVTVPAFTGRLAQSEAFRGLLAAYRAVSAQDEVQYANVSHNTSFQVGGPTAESVVAVVTLGVPRVDDAALAERLARLIVANDEHAADKSAILVKLVYGYDMGIASAWRSKTYQFEPNTLRP